MDYAPDELLSDTALQVQSEARLQQIMAQQAPNADLRANSRRGRTARVAIATAVTIALGLGGATAATAAGLSNPVGDWITEQLLAPSISVAAQATIPVSSPENLMVFDQMVCTYGFVVMPIAFVGVEVRHPDVYDNSEIQRAIQILNDIELASLGYPLPEMRVSEKNNGFEFGANASGLFRALRAEFKKRILDAGFIEDESEVLFGQPMPDLFKTTGENPVNFMLVQTTGCQ